MPERPELKAAQQSLTEGLASIEAKLGPLRAGVKPARAPGRGLHQDAARLGSLLSPEQCQKLDNLRRKHSRKHTPEVNWDRPRPWWQFWRR
ncbi:MAG: hypothetical protein K0Q72_597 [Armatimonadetes bacterium]|jgi:hypothetical protein|nr:hypothetical protein [Armatimonadota bacterium]